MSPLPPPISGAALTFRDVSVTLGGVSILEAVTAQVPRGGCTAIVGPNGAGKTTLLLTLLRQIPYSGFIRIDSGHSGGEARIGYVPQRLAFDRGMPLTVMEFLAMGQDRWPLWFGVRRRCRDRCMDLLASVKAETLANRRLGALSGGEIQRVLLALALAQEPDLLVLDEPSAGVDMQGEHIFCELLDTLRCQRCFTQLMVSHDLAMVTHHATHAICLKRRVIAQGTPKDVLTAETLTTLFGLHMGLVNARALPDENPACSAPCCRGGGPDA